MKTYLLIIITFTTVILPPHVLTSWGAKDVRINDPVRNVGKPSMAVTPDGDFYIVAKDLGLQWYYIYRDLSIVAVADTGQTHLICQVKMGFQRPESGLYVS